MRARAAAAVEQARYVVGMGIVGGVACVGVAAIGVCVAGAMLALAVSPRAARSMLF
jgi:hypothetical protein